MVEPVKDRKNPGQAAEDTPGTPAGGQTGSPSATAPQKPRAGRPANPRSIIVRLFAGLVYALVITGVVGYAIFIFRDRDERVKVVADFIESKLGAAQQLMDAAPGPRALLFGEEKNAAPQNDVAGGPEPAVQPAGPVAAVPESPVNDRQETQPTPANENLAAPGPENLPHPQPEPETPQPVEAPKSVENAAPAVAEIKTASSAKDELSSMDLVNALEGRVEALSEELKSLREKLAQVSKEGPSEQRAGGYASEAATVVLAFALQKELESGRPYADEIAALTRTGANPALLGVLATMAESGAPTGARLRENFKPLAKKFRAEEPSEEQDLATHIIHGASKLVRVRPTGAEQPETLDGNLAKIDAALTHDDYAAAAAAFAALPEWARSQAGEFAQTLDKRLAVAKASENLLHGAIAALGGVRK